MIILMKPGAGSEDVAYIVGRAKSLGLDTHVSRDGDRARIQLLGDTSAIEPAAISGMRGVDRIVAAEQPFRLASRQFHPDRTLVNVGPVVFGGDGVVAIAGPCSVETRQQVLEVARGVKEGGAHMLRGGAFKPRTSPYSFQGLGEEGLKYLAEARQETGLPVVTEVMAVDQVDLVARYADMLQIGARNMQNFDLLRAVGGVSKPVLLKRGMMSTMEELLLSAEYILSQGNSQVVLCERGIRTFEKYTRNTLDINAVPVLQEKSHLPVIVDPSHATGLRSLVKPMTLAGIAAGADGFIVEVHPDPEHALSDGPQSLTPAMFAGLLDAVRPVAAGVARKI